jgi:hypothetical protein
VPQVRQVLSGPPFCFANLQEFLTRPFYSLARPQCAEMLDVMLNRCPKAEICEAVCLHSLGNLPCLDDGPTLFLRKLPVLSALVQKLDLLLASEQPGVFLVDEISSPSLASLPEVANVGIAGMAVPLTDTHKSAFHCANLQENALRSKKKRLQNAYSPQLSSCNGHPIRFVEPAP